MDWTTESPTQEGWYWSKSEDDEIEVVHVTKLSHDIKLLVRVCEVDFLYPLSHFTHWLGPLSIPNSPDVKSNP